MAERNQLARALRRHDPGELRGCERIALRQVVEPPRRLRRHPHLGVRDGAAARQLLAADVDHAHRSRLVDVAELAHCLLRFRMCRSAPRCRQAARQRSTPFAVEHVERRAQCALGLVVVREPPCRPQASAVGVEVLHLHALVQPCFELVRPKPELLTPPHDAWPVVNE